MVMHCPLVATRWYSLLCGMLVTMTTQEANALALTNPLQILLFTKRDESGKFVFCFGN